MFSLIITIVAVTLTVSLTAATMYYAGDSTAKGDAATAAASVLTQTEQVGAAIQLREVQTNQALLNSVDQLVADNYLSALPVPADRAYQTGKVPSALDWTVVKPAPVPMVMLQNKIREDVCSLVNEKLHQGAVIKATMDPTRRIQCFGAAEPYTVVINPSANEAVVHESVDHWNATPEVVAKTDPEITPLPEPAAKGGPVVFSGTVTLDPATLPSWKVGDTVSYDFSTLFKTSDTSTPDMSTVVWSSPDTLPKGLTVDPATGALSGKPTEKGTVDYTLKATYKDVTGQQIYKIVVRGLELEAIAVYTGHMHSCAIMLDTTVKCWGANTYGQLGDGTTTNRLKPVQVKNLTGVKSLALGSVSPGSTTDEGSTCALLTNGQIHCWGHNFYGQLGLGNTTSRSLPTKGIFNGGVTDIAMGAGHACAVIYDGSLYCWGNNRNGQVGLNSTTTQFLWPNKVSITGVAKISARSYSTCATDTSGAAYCWGANGAGQVGYGYPGGDVRVPTLVYGTFSGVFKYVQVGSYHSCGLTKAGGVQCWGGNGSQSPSLSHGALGTGNLTSYAYPQNVVGLASGVAKLTVGEHHNCALMDTGAVKCWGAGYPVYPSDEFVMQPPPSLYTTKPITMRLPGPATDIVSGREYACAKVSDVFYCWGTNNVGQGGTGTASTALLTPSAVMDPDKL